MVLSSLQLAADRSSETKVTAELCGVSAMLVSAQQVHKSYRTAQYTLRTFHLWCLFYKEFYSTVQ